MKLNTKIRDPLFLEDWPLLFFIFWTWRELKGSIISLYQEKYPFCGFGPSPGFILSRRHLLDNWRFAKSRMFSRFRFPTFQ